MRPLRAQRLFGFSFSALSRDISLGPSSYLVFYFFILPCESLRQFCLCFINNVRVSWYTRNFVLKDFMYFDLCFCCSLSVVYM